MRLIESCLTAEFIQRRTTLTWREIAYGIDNELLAPGSGVAFAVQSLASDKSTNALVSELAGMQSGERTQELVGRIASLEAEQDSDYIHKKWLYLILSWTFEHQNAYPDPLVIVEEVYAQFDYPEELASFVPYMPMRGPDLGSLSANRKRLLDNWKQYLEEAELTFGHPKQK